ncbi:MAG: serine/threonine protein phosphatase [Deltaproteobacteria bacterium]|nr:serine/threonine protein phosphatase [Deltaproteobacteria bacterium]
MTVFVEKVSVPGRVFAVGDIHGCPDEVWHLVEYLGRKEGFCDDDAIIFLGDYIDRGPDSKGVIELMIEFRKRFRNAYFLKGNHEDMLLSFLEFGGRMGEAFLYNGGLETMQSYCISVFSAPRDMVNMFPEEHFKFFCSLGSAVRTNGEVYVHAGLNPEVPMEKQIGDDVFWIRDEFIACKHGFDLTVVFGHTPHREVFVHLPYKVGIDTGLVFGNKLSCLELKSRRVYQIKRNSNSVSCRKLGKSLKLS